MLSFIFYRPNSHPARLLVFRTGSIGDNICALPAIVSIRNHFRESEIDLLTTAGAQNLVSLERLLSPRYYDRLIDYAGFPPRALRAALRAHRYDMVIELPMNMVGLKTQVRNLLFFRFVGIKSGWGWHVTTSKWFRQTQEKFGVFQREADRLLAMLSANGVAPTGRGMYPLNITAEEKAAVNAMVEREVAPGRTLIGLVPGAKRSQNRYPIDRFMELSRWLVDRGYAVVIIGGPEDTERGALMSVPGTVINFCGRLTPTESGALLSKCFLTISNDTGPMHLSYSVGTPVLALFSSRDFPHKWFPPESSKVLRNDEIPCSLCLSETCQNNICMKGITLESVKTAFAELEEKYGRA